MGGEKKRDKENLREQDTRDREEQRWEQRKIYIEGDKRGLARSLTLEKFPGSHKDDSS